MAFNPGRKHRSVPEIDGKGREMTMDEFKKWLKGFDADGDGQISAQELRKAIRSSGTGWFSGAKARRVLCSVDANSNGYIDDNEISKLLVFAHTQFGFTIVS